MRKKGLSLTINNVEVFYIDFPSILLFIILMGFLVDVTLPIGGLFHFVIPLSEVVIMFLSFFVILFKGNRTEQDHSLMVKRTRFLISGIFFCIYIFATRIIMFAKGFDPELITYPRITFFFFLSVFFIYSYFKKADTRYIYLAVLLFTAFLSLLELIFVIQNNDLRSSKLLTNINIYVCYIIIISPTILSVYFNSKRKLIRYVSLAIELFSATLVLFSGSRAGTLLLIFIFLLELFWAKKIGRKIFTLLVIVIGGFLILQFINQSDLLESLQRSLSGAIFNNVFSNQNAVISDNVRQTIWLSAWNQIKEHPIIGPGNLLFDFYMDIYKVHQSAHNFLLEILMSYGFLGAPLYFSSLFFGSSFLQSNNILSKRNYIVSLIMFMMFSFVEPTFVERILIFSYLLSVSLDIKKIVE